MHFQIVLRAEANFILVKDIKQTSGSSQVALNHMALSVAIIAVGESGCSEQGGQGFLHAMFWIKINTGLLLKCS